MKTAIRIAVFGLLAIVGAIVYRKGEPARLNNRGYELIQQRQFSLAVDVLSEARSKYPNNAAILKNLGLAYDGLNDTQKAREAYQAALALAPSLTDVGSRLEEIGETTGLQRRAAERIARLKAEGWTDDTATMQETLDTAETLFNVGNYEQAIMVFERALFKDPGDMDLEIRIEQLEAKVASGEI